MRLLFVLAPCAVLLGACDPPPAQPGKAVLELYMHPNGLSRCVDEDGERWKADASCCPEGFELAGFSVPSAFEYLVPPTDPDAKAKPKRRIYRHAVCIQR